MSYYFSTPTFMYCLCLCVIYLSLFIIPLDRPIHNILYAYSLYILVFSSPSADCCLYIMFYVNKYWIKMTRSILWMNEINQWWASHVRTKLTIFLTIFFSPSKQKFDTDRGIIVCTHRLHNGVLSMTVNDFFFYSFSLKQISKAEIGVFLFEEDSRELRTITFF